MTLNPAAAQSLVAAFWILLGVLVVISHGKTRFPSITMLTGLTQVWWGLSLIAVVYDIVEIPLWLITFFGISVPIWLLANMAAHVWYRPVQRDE